MRKFIVVVLTFLVVCSIGQLPSFALEVFIPGVSVVENTEDEFPADYVAKFVYENDDVDITKVEVKGGFQFYQGTSPDYYDAFHYQEGMFPGGYVYSDGSNLAYEMIEVEPGLYSVSLPLPANQYFYRYSITYDDGTVEEIKDPSNMPLVNDDSDANWSLFYVGNELNYTAGQEYIYPRSNFQGTYSFVEYQAIDETMQPLGVYLPYGYSPTKTYKTIYVSHGGWGNEVEWMTIGSVPNIMDNLIAAGLTEEAVVVTMDNDYFGFDQDLTVDNMNENIIPYIEANYSVSTHKDDRAMCGLSAGGTVTANTLVYSNDTFSYYGVWSPRNTVLKPLIEDGTIQEDIYSTYTDALYHIGVGVLDIELRQQQEEDLYDVLTNTVEAPATLTYVDGLHDWYVWRNLFTDFAMNALWSKDITPDDYNGGVAVSPLDSEEYAAGYQAEFTYVGTADVADVSLLGGFQFYNQAQADEYNLDYDGSMLKSYDAYHYQEGMFSTGYDLSLGASLEYPMEEIDNNVFSVTLPLPGNEYYYGYKITYKDGTIATIEDPANPSTKNGDNDPTWSYFFVGSSADCQTGQELIYPRTDDSVGTSQYVQYEAVDGTMQPLGIYLPFNYDINKEYKTIYLSHGAEGNETEWFQLGAATNIMDNLIASGQTEEAIIVTMDNTHFNDTIFWDWNIITDNLMDYIIPYVESHYNVMTSREGRAFAGLSNGSRFASQILYTNADDFEYIGMFSRALTDVVLSEVDSIDETEIYFSIGSLETNSTIDTWREMMADANIDYTFDLYNAAHDWNMWRYSFARFVDDICWTNEEDTDETSAGSTIVDTGDNAEMMLYVSMLSCSLMGLAIVAIKKRRHA